MGKIWRHYVIGSSPYNAYHWSIQVMPEGTLPYADSWIEEGAAFRGADGVVYEIFYTMHHTDSDAYTAYRNSEHPAYRTELTDLSV